ncbi:hypothetical protein BLNAU_12882 [Blattamonas nauphoetae]|uniref:Uncharacterized protein n=1 Tax=Blattamonas nauphoetae TaxID=2049346 RepID=A0ABQ9XN15_9EUKA|nr:hypothetical protein BLNAU_12882 [Blattamonas nauphoetae]
MSSPSRKRSSEQRTVSRGRRGGPQQMAPSMDGSAGDIINREIEDIYGQKLPRGNYNGPSMYDGNQGKKRTSKSPAKRSRSSKSPGDGALFRNYPGPRPVISTRSTKFTDYDKWDYNRGLLDEQMPYNSEFSINTPSSFDQEPLRKGKKRYRSASSNKYQHGSDGYHLSPTDITETESYYNDGLLTPGANYKSSASLQHPRTKHLFSASSVQENDERRGRPFSSSTHNSLYSQQLGREAFLDSASQSLVSTMNETARTASHDSVVEDLNLFQRDGKGRVLDGEDMGLQTMRSDRSKDEEDEEQKERKRLEGIRLKEKEEEEERLFKQEEERKQQAEEEKKRKKAERERKRREAEQKRQEEEENLRMRVEVEENERDEDDEVDIDVDTSMASDSEWSQDDTDFNGSVGDESNLRVRQMLQNMEDNNGDADNDADLTPQERQDKKDRERVEALLKQCRTPNGLDLSIFLIPLPPGAQPTTKPQTIPSLPIKSSSQSGNKKQPIEPSNDDSVIRGWDVAGGGIDVANTKVKLGELLLSEFEERKRNKLETVIVNGQIRMRDGTLPPSQKGGKAQKDMRTGLQRHYDAIDTKKREQQELEQSRAERKMRADERKKKAKK